MLTSGLGANDIAITILQKGSTGQIIGEHVLEGELTRIQELLSIYVTNLKDTVTVIDAGTNTILKTIPLPAGSGPIGIATTPDGSGANVANEGINTVTVINTATDTILATIFLLAGSGPVKIAITPDGSHAYVTNLHNRTITVINTATSTILTTIPLPADGDPGGIAITPDSSRAYVANELSSTSSLIIIQSTIDTLF